MKAQVSPIASVAASILILQSCIIIGKAVDPVKHYCSRNASNPVEVITGEAEGSIYTLYPGDSHYRNNQKCVWMIDAGQSNRVEITVVSSDLQWAHPSSICPGYDHVAIKDALSSSSSAEGAEGGEESIVLQWCGHSQPLGAISSGRYVQVEFMSDQNNPYQYRGVHLKFEIFSSSDCAPSWSLSPAGFCFKLLDKEVDWSSAQRECNAERANLASVSSETEHDFLLQTFGSAGQTAWIGLSDIVQQGKYQWIDGAELIIDKFSQDHRADKYFHCVALQFSEETWEVQDCEGFQTKPLCKSNKGKKTDIFPIPQARERDNKMPTATVVALVVAAVCLAILVLVGVGLYRRLKSQERRAAYRTPKHADTDPPHDRGADAGDGHEGARSVWSSMPGNRGVGQEPSALAAEAGDAHVIINPTSQTIAPPAYEEAMSHPVLSSGVEKYP